jgi:hypothetical protein
MSSTIANIRTNFKKTMAIYRKYEFSTEEDANTLIIALDDSGRNITTAAVHHLGVLPSGSNYCVDVLWRNEEPDDWYQFQVWSNPTGSAHFFAGWEEIYKLDYENYFK